jgi:N-methylhydantoinase A
VRASWTADLRYRGQSYTLEVPWEGPDGSTEAFAAAHRARYGHRLDLAVELVNVRVAVTGPPVPLALQPAPQTDPAPPAYHAALPGTPSEVPVHARSRLGQGGHIEGPAVVTEALATTWIAPGWAATVDAVGNLRLTRPGWPPDGPRV